jgi:hypothetical protein
MSNHLEKYREAARRAAQETASVKSRSQFRSEWKLLLLGFVLGLLFNLTITIGPALDHHWNPVHEPPPNEKPIIVVSHGRWREAYYMSDSQSYHSTEDGTRIVDITWWMDIPPAP